MLHAVAAFMQAAPLHDPYWQPRKAFVDGTAATGRHSKGTIISCYASPLLQYAELKTSGSTVIKTTKHVARFQGDGVTAEIKCLPDSALKCIGVRLPGAREAGRQAGSVCHELLLVQVA